MNIGRFLAYLGVASMALLFACTHDDAHGHMKEDTVVANIRPGTSTKDDTLRLLGSPSSESSFGPPTWYYISSIKRNHSLIAPVVVDQNVTEIVFDNGGVVAEIKQYTLADGKQVQMASRVTPSEGQTLGFFEQIIGNLGRFNNSSGSSTSNNHGGGTVPGIPPVGR